MNRKVKIFNGYYDTVQDQVNKWFETLPINTEIFDIKHTTYDSLVTVAIYYYDINTN